MKKLAFKFMAGVLSRTWRGSEQPDLSRLHLLTAGSRENNWLDGWTHDGRHLMVTSNLRTSDARDGWLFDNKSGELKILAQNNGSGQFTYISRDSR